MHGRPKLLVHVGVDVAAMCSESFLDRWPMRLSVGSHELRARIGQTGKLVCSLECLPGSTPEEQSKRLFVVSAASPSPFDSGLVVRSMLQLSSAFQEFAAEGRSQI